MDQHRNSLFLPLLHSLPLSVLHVAHGSSPRCSNPPPRMANLTSNYLHTILSNTMVLPLPFPLHSDLLIPSNFRSQFCSLSPFHCVQTRCRKSATMVGRRRAPPRC
ncbi:hypothetical protein BDA96_03G190100 [Sorghum bicolor]|uniref:Secreted protein n=2 Tax=Sorghum bicolor TaxID=4558 RepID=A0A921RDR5_SORBI|nr:hypothetical protein BDA96_03G190100 [Sorghum bicolor]KXG32618.1 hypothetical protein SORBI_3003G175500 [Sorghum bicolor]